MAVHYDFESLLSEMEKDVGKSLNRVSKQIVEIWQKLVEDKYYSVFEPSIYERTFKSVESIRKLDFRKTSNGYEVAIGYDTDIFKPETFTGKDGNEWNRHGLPEAQPYFIEYGFTYGRSRNKKRKGAHAFEEMLNYVTSKDFLALLSVELNKLGYELKY